MSSNTPTLMESEERTLNELNSEPQDKWVTISLCLSKSLKTKDIEGLRTLLYSEYSKQDWYIDDLEIIEE